MANRDRRHQGRKPYVALAARGDHRSKGARLTRWPHAACGSHRQLLRGRGPPGSSVQHSCPTSRMCVSPRETREQPSRAACSLSGLAVPQDGPIRSLGVLDPLFRISCGRLSTGARISAAGGLIAVTTTKTTRGCASFQTGQIIYRVDVIDLRGSQRHSHVVERKDCAVANAQKLGTVAWQPLPTASR